MALLSSLFVLGAAFQTAGALQNQRNKRQLLRMQADEMDFQSEVANQIFSVTQNQLVKQNKAQLGRLATERAKGGVATESVSTLAILGEQARTNSLRESLALQQHNLEQRNRHLSKKLGKRQIKFSKQNSIFTLGAGLTGVGTGLVQGGAFQGSTVTTVPTDSNDSSTTSSIKNTLSLTDTINTEESLKKLLSIVGD